MRKNSYLYDTDKEQKVTVIVIENSEFIFEFDTVSDLMSGKCPQEKQRLKIKTLCLILPFDFEVNLEHLMEAYNSELIF